MGSASELEYHHILLAQDLGYIEPSVYQQLTASVIEVKKMLRPFIKKLKS